MSFTEANYENAILEIFRDHLGYEYIYGPDVKRDYTEPLYLDVLLDILPALNPGIRQEAIDEAIEKIRNIENAALNIKNAYFTDMLQNGVDVNYFNGQEQQSTKVKLIDFDLPMRNRFIVTNQWTVDDRSVRRVDIIVFVNGLPLVVFELKSPSNDNTNASEAYAQLRNYMQEIPSLFVYNAFCVMSDLALTKVGTITAKEDRFMEWKSIDGKLDNSGHAAFEVAILGMFEKSRFIEILEGFICCSLKDGNIIKILSAYHQFYAVRKAVQSTIRASKTDGRGGVFWHTQGSGKSLSMVFFAKQLIKIMSSPTIVVLTDRNDLDGQLYTQFSQCQKFLRQGPIQATSRAHLKELLDGHKANGIFFSTIQKFEDGDSPLSERRDIIVMVDEAHRSQYGLEEKIDSRTGKIKHGAARLMRNALPNAIYVGFTGTPISQKDRSTREVFGDNIDIYDMTQAVEDKATRPVFYESRVINIKLDKEILRRIDEEYDAMAAETEEYAIDKSKRELGRLDSILGADETVESLCNDIVNHYEKFRQWEQTGKAMIVAYSRPIAMKMYHRIMEMRPAWKDKLAVVMTSSNKDPEEWREIIGNDAYKTKLATDFKDDNGPLKIVIVVDMWLTGFDLPSLSTMYVYKPMSGHNLMQAIARVNRVFGDKKGGLVVDYVGIASALKKAMKEYTARDIENYGDLDVSKTAYPEFLKNLEVCRDLLHRFDYSRFLGESDLERAKAICGGADFLQDPTRTKQKETYIKQALMLRHALSLCQSLLNKEQRLEAAYFEAVRTILTRIEGKGKISFRQINERINELLKQSIQSSGVINLFSDLKEEFSLFDPKFLKEINQMKQRNLAVELLRKLIAEQVQVYKRINKVRAGKFSEILSNSMSNYLKGLLTNEEVIEELLKIAKEIINGEKDGKKLKLTSEELAFYDALTTPEAIHDFYTNEELLAITHELTDALRKNKTIDWNLKESARAGMRRIVKRLLRKYNYPPEGQEDALNMIMAQCEMWSENN